MQTGAERGSRAKTITIVLVSVFVPLALIVWIFVSLTTPKHFPVFTVGRVSCVVHGSSALVELQIAPISGGGLYIERAQQIDANNASTSAYGRLPPGIGFASAEVVPTPKQLSATFAADGYYPSLKTESLSPLLVKFRLSGAVARVRAIGVTVDAGEPVFYQELPINLSVRNGYCSVRTTS